MSQSGGAPATAPAPVPWPTAWALATAAGRADLVRQAGFGIAQALLPVAGLFAMQRLVDAVADGLAGRVPAADALAAATLATGVAAAVAFAGSLVRALAAVSAEDHGRRLGDAGLAAVQQHAAQVDLAAYDRAAFHDLLQRALGEAGQRPVRLVQDLVATLVAALGLGAMVLLLAGVAAWLPLLVGLAAVPLAVARRRHARLRFAWQQQHVGVQRDVGYLGAVLTGRATSKDVRVLQLAAPLGGRLATLRAGLRQSLRRLALRRGRDDVLVHTLGSLGLFGAYVVLVHRALGGQLTLGELVLQAQAAQRAQNGVRDLLAALAAVGEHRLFLQPVAQFLAQRPALVGAVPPATPAPGPIAVQAAGLCFRYPDSGAEVLRGLDLTIAAGERFAVVGRNGSGKSTLIKLLCRLYDPTAGALLVDGTPLAACDPVAWRRRLAVLLQDAALFELTVRDNLRLGHAAPPDDAALWQGLAAVGLETRVRALPGGLDTMCSRRHVGGVEWSTGEARRLVLARTLLQPADLVLLDEPFQGLDAAAVAAVGAWLLARARTSTIVIADHHGAAMRLADRVLVLDAGAVVACDSPAVLARRDPPIGSDRGG